MSFLFGKEEATINDVQSKSFINKDFAVNANTDPFLKTRKLYYYYSVALHEIGHILGFGHYDYNTGAGYIPSCTDVMIIMV